MAAAEFPIIDSAHRFEPSKGGDSVHTVPPSQNLSTKTHYYQVNQGDNQGLKLELFSTNTQNSANFLTSSSSNKATLSFANGSKVELDIRFPTQGSPAIDVSGLVKHGYIVIDKGAQSSAFCESKITFVNGLNGELQYRGFPIEQLCKHKTYTEVCLLLHHGELPTSEEVTKFEENIKKALLPWASLVSLFIGTEELEDPVDKFSIVIKKLSAITQSQKKPTTSQRQTLLANFLPLVAMCYRSGYTTKWIAPKDDLTMVENFIHMMFSNDEHYDRKPAFEKAIHTLLIIHADHGQNASTNALRAAVSSKSTIYNCFTAALDSLSGNAHGKANKDCLTQLKEYDTTELMDAAIEKAKKRGEHNNFRLAGIGHRAYKTYDPRDRILVEYIPDIFNKLGIQDLELFHRAQMLENKIVKDEYFSCRKLYPNLDFRSGILMDALGIPEDMFTLMFAAGRGPAGWIAHWDEATSAAPPLQRPKQVYQGHTRREIVQSDKSL